jgi:hypothetical protein
MRHSPSFLAAILVLGSATAALAQDATGSTDCYATAGGPAQNCSYSVTRTGNGGAFVTVTLPAGQTRVITYENGQPTDFDRAEADGDIAFEHWQQDGGFMVFIGDQGVYIPDDAIVGG